MQLSTVSSLRPGTLNGLSWVDQEFVVSSLLRDNCIPRQFLKGLGYAILGNFREFQP